MIFLMRVLSRPWQQLFQPLVSPVTFPVCLRQLAQPFIPAVKRIGFHGGAHRASGLARMGFLMAVDKQTNRRTQTQQHGKNDNNDDDWRLAILLPTALLLCVGYLLPAASSCCFSCLLLAILLPTADCSPTVCCPPAMLFTIANAVSGRLAMVAELAANGRRAGVYVGSTPACPRQYYQGNARQLLLHCRQLP